MHFWLMLMPGSVGLLLQMICVFEYVPNFEQLRILRTMLYYTCIAI